MPLITHALTGYVFEGAATDSPTPPEGCEGPCLLSHGFTLYEHTNNAWSVRERRTGLFPVAQQRIWGMSMEEPAGSAVNVDLRISL